VGIRSWSWQNAQSKRLPGNVPLPLRTCPGSLRMLWSFKPHEKHLAACSVLRNSSLAAGRLLSGCFCVPQAHFELSASFAWLWKSTGSLQPFMFKLGIFTQWFWLLCEVWEWVFKHLVSLLLVFYWLLG